MPRVKQTARKRLAAEQIEAKKDAAELERDVDYNEWTVAELKNALNSRGEKFLSTTRKSGLVQKLEDWRHDTLLLKEQAPSHRDLEAAKSKGGRKAKITPTVYVLQFFNREPGRDRNVKTLGVFPTIEEAEGVAKNDDVMARYGANLIGDEDNLFYIEEFPLGGYGEALGRVLELEYQ